MRLFFRKGRDAELRRVREQCRRIVEPWALWKEVRTEEEQYAAALSLQKLSQLLKCVQPTPVPRQEHPCLSLSYLNTLSLVASALRFGQYCDACNELDKLIYFEPINQRNILRNVVALLDSELEGFSCLGSGHETKKEC